MCKNVGVDFPERAVKELKQRSNKRPTCYQFWFLLYLWTKSTKYWPAYFLLNSCLLNTDHIFLFLTPATDSKAGILVPLGRNFRIIFEFVPSRLFLRRVWVTTKWKRICADVSNRICSALRIKKQKCQKTQGALSTKLTNKHREDQFVSWIILTCWNFLALRVGIRFAM